MGTSARTIKNCEKHYAKSGILAVKVPRRGPQNARSPARPLALLPGRWSPTGTPGSIPCPPPGDGFCWRAEPGAGPPLPPRPRQPQRGGGRFRSPRPTLPKRPSSRHLLSWPRRHLVGKSRWMRDSVSSAPILVSGASQLSSSPRATANARWGSSHLFLGIILILNQPRARCSPASVICYILPHGFCSIIQVLAGGQYFR